MGDQARVSPRDASRKFSGDAVRAERARQARERQAQQRAAKAEERRDDMDATRQYERAQIRDHLDFEEFDMDSLIEESERLDL